MKNTTYFLSFVEDRGKQNKKKKQGHNSKGGDTREMRGNRKKIEAEK
jgi:hypothetical protein